MAAVVVSGVKNHLRVLQSEILFNGDGSGDTVGIIIRNRQIHSLRSVREADYLR